MIHSAKRLATALCTPTLRHRPQLYDEKNISELLQITVAEFKAVSPPVRTNVTIFIFSHSGITNGEEIIFRVAFKPPATISLAQKTSNYDGW